MASKKTRKYIAAGILFLSLVAIVVTGFGTNGFGGMGALGGGGPAPTDELAKVDGETITASQASEQFTQTFNRTKQDLPNLELGEFVRQNGYEGAVSQLINFAALRHYAEARGIVASRRMIDAYIVNVPLFHNAVGQFDQGIFQQRLQQLNVTEEFLRRDLARELLREQLLGPIRAGARVPRGVAQAYAAMGLEQRRGMVGVVPIGAIEAGINPSDAEITAYYARNRVRFTVPERRVIKYALIGPEQVPAPAVSEQEIATVYRATPRYQQREQRTLQAIVLPDQAAAQAFAARVRGGANFVQAAGQAGFQASDVTFTDRSREQFAQATNAEVAAAAFGAAQGDVVGPIRSPLGFSVIRVERISRLSGQPLDAVRGAIRAEIERRKRVAAISALGGEVEARLDERMSFEEAARSARLAVVVTPPITAAGRLTNGQPWAMPAELRPLLAGAFEMDADNPTPEVAAVGETGRFALIAVDRAEPAAPPPLAQIRDRVRAALVRETALRRAEQVARGIVQRINAGVPAARAFAEAGGSVRAPTVLNARRADVMRRDRPVEPALAILFRIRVRTAEAIRTPGNDGWIVVAAEESVRGTNALPPAIVTQAQQELGTIAPSEFEQGFARAVERRSSVQRNADAIRAERRRLESTVGTR